MHRAEEKATAQNYPWSVGAVKTHSAWAGRRYIDIFHLTVRAATLLFSAKLYRLFKLPHKY